MYMHIYYKDIFLPLYPSLYEAEENQTPIWTHRHETVSASLAKFPKPKKHKYNTLDNLQL